MTHLHTRDGTALSRLTFGTMQFGGRADAATSRAMYDAARAAGVNHFDTAVRYTEGAAETLLGPMVAPERDAIYLATKVAYAGGAGRVNILEQFDICRSQLQMDSVDLLYLHRWDDETPLEETFATMARLQADGAIRHIGVSNYAAWQVMKAQAVCATFETRIDVMQPMYNLVKRQAEVEILPMAADQGIKVCSYSPLGGGLLTGKYARGETGRLSEDKMYAARYGRDWMHDAGAALADMADAVGTDAATLAVAWVAAHPTAPSPIISAKSVAQLDPSLAANAFQMTADLYDRITALSPTPPPATDRLEEA
ncbi:aldo/keto reductase [Loktanella sp. M215]|uniref:aldo/keto reductase n=1 Tax=Loktanella sp. M215 TaxID=2675431 RepID=UPI001F356198|nr:aldo/keto reductase [Loktanella sp. M215]MCF7698089.1 aldo/keto reductase [Loktanella sp. M215]